IGDARPDVEDAGIADEHVELPESAHRFSYGPLVVGELSDIAGDPDCRLAELRAHLVGAGRDPLHDCDARTFLDKTGNPRPPDAGAAAGDQRHLSVELTHHAPSVPAAFKLNAAGCRIIHR